MEVTQSKLNRLATSSKEFFVRSGRIGQLTIREYYDPSNSITIDLSKLTPEIVEMISPDEEKGEEVN